MGLGNQKTAATTVTSIKSATTVMKDGSDRTGVLRDSGKEGLLEVKCNNYH